MSESVNVARELTIYRQCGCGLAGDLWGLCCSWKPFFSLANAGNGRGGGHSDVWSWVGRCCAGLSVVEAVD